MTKTKITKLPHDHKFEPVNYGAVKIHNASAVWTEDKGNTSRVTLEANVLPYRSI